MNLNEARKLDWADPVKRARRMASLKKAAKKRKVEGRYGHSKEIREIISKNTKKAMTPERIEKIKIARARQTKEGKLAFGKHQISPEGRKNLAHWTGVPCKPELAKKISKSVRRTYREHPEIAKKISDNSFRLWKDPIFIHKVHSGNGKKPNLQEQALFNILQEMFPGQYALNTQAEILTVAGKVPDIVNLCQKKLIELFGDYWHQGDNPRKRIRLFHREGNYDTLVVWGHELKNFTKLKLRLTEFHQRGGGML